MQTAKQEAIEAIQRLPDTVNTEEMMYRLYVLDKIRKGRQAAAEGKTMTSEELQKEIETW
uniref:Addiction module component n=1 Tax=Candidatus Kentrum sp. LPFa TaxID=2126335 RepID=A0A450XZN3_9GAMM|nr:MAG: hypothetical protein BECKLPF1236A_GA0070988_102966 [Candidatus Kentron sp. LPFa]VFK34715.1 MAG: hypothetical protein BECKLPF1236C_GA0070990_102936 [Candidatus Kentron sp. LPFa]